MEEIEKRGGEAESIRVQEEVEEISGKEPAAMSPNLICEDRFEGLPLCHSVNEMGEIDAGEDGQLQRPPETGINLHQLGGIIPGIYFELDHGYTEPVQGLEQRQPQFQNLRV